ncbi:MAG: UPF0175 family protein [Candidatus Nanohaloarchaea archaeon]|nr:UPF0175 family protein [Candidatus Nanohaloarchaea archaeon]
MVAVSARVSEKLEEDLEAYMDEEKLDKSVAVRKLIYVGLKDWKIGKAVELLRRGKVSLSKAAEIAEMNIWEFSEEIRDRKITWIKGEDLEKDLEAL